MSQPTMSNAAMPGAAASQYAVAGQAREGVLCCGAEAPASRAFTSLWSRGGALTGSQERPIAALDDKRAFQFQLAVDVGVE
jgi:hypothetical protein